MLLLPTACFPHKQTLTMFTDLYCSKGATRINILSFHHRFRQDLHRHSGTILLRHLKGWFTDLYCTVLKGQQELIVSYLTFPPLIWAGSPPSFWHHPSSSAEGVVQGTSETGETPLLVDHHRLPCDPCGRRPSQRHEPAT